MKKLIGLLVVIALMVVGCTAKEDIGKLVSSKVYSYSVSDWKKSDKKSDEIVEKIIKIWEDNNELYNVNFKVNKDSVKGRIDEYITEKEPKQETSIFVVASEIVGIDSNSYKIK